MTAVRDTRLLFVRHTLQLLRDPVWLFVGFSTPILYLALFTPLLQNLPGLRAAPTGAVLALFLPGILALLAFTTGSTMGFNTVFELQSGLIERLRVTPASRLALLIGPIVSALAMMTVFDAVLVVLATAFGFPVHAGGLLLLVVLLWLLGAAFASFSTAVALRTKEIGSFAAVVNGMNLPLLLLSGVLLPISLGPAWLRAIAHLDPLYYLVEAARALAAGHLGAPAVIRAFAVLVPVFVAAAAWATFTYRRAVA
jgi:ABC-2 type transport system permease protein